MAAASPAKAATDAQWKLQENAANTTVADSSGNSRTGTASANTSALHASGGGPGGQFPHAFTFNGTSHYVVATGYKGVTGTAARTFLCWFKTSSASTSTRICHWGQSLGAKEWSIKVENGVIWFRGNGTTRSWGSGYNNGAWHHLAITFPAGGQTQDLTCYVDGSSVASSGGAGGTTALDTGSTFDVHIGSSYGPGDYYPGSLADVRIVDTALDQAAIQAIMAEATATGLSKILQQLSALDAQSRYQQEHLERYGVWALCP